MKAIKLSVAVAAAALSTGAMANVVTDAASSVTDTVVNSGRTVFKTVTAPAAVSAEIGTLGYGANVAWSANDTTEVVAGWTGGDLSMSTDIGGTDSIINWTKVLGKEYADTKGRLRVKADFSNPYIGVNLRPFANRFTVSTGVIFQDNTLTATLTPEVGANSITVHGKTYNVTGGDVMVKADSGRDLAPYLTIGFKPNSDKRFGMFGELGAVYTGEWDTKVDVSGNVTGAGAAEQLKEDLTNRINDKNPEWYPIIKLGATYRF